MTQVSRVGAYGRRVSANSIGGTGCPLRRVERNSQICVRTKKSKRLSEALSNLWGTQSQLPNSDDNCYHVDMEARDARARKRRRYSLLVLLLLMTVIALIATSPLLPIFRG
jgi:membrane glycosyltransferase